MNINEAKNAFLSGKYDNSLNKIYVDVKSSQQRYAKLCDMFSEQFGRRENVRFFSAPGRTEIGGNHTDHQHGCVLAGSVNLDVIAAVSPNSENIVRIKSEGFDMDTIDLSDLGVHKDETGNSAALIRGVLSIFKEKGYCIGGFDAYTTSNVLKGSGLSSSAAFEVLINNILNGMFNDDKIDPIEIAKISQRAEREFFGKPCGLLDQMASSQGGFTAIDFYSTENPIVEKIDFDFGKCGYALCVVDTHGDHADLTEDYAAIPYENAQISEFFGKSFLRDVDEELFYGKISDLRALFGDRAVLRAIHFFEENKRAVLLKEFLKNDDFKSFLNAVNESGNSSYKYLQNVYSISQPKNQGLCVALALTDKFLEGDGACRVHGGGFAGTIQCYIPVEKLEKYRNMIDAVFGSGSCTVLNIRKVGGCEVK